MRENRLLSAVFLLLAACSTDGPLTTEPDPSRVAGVPDGWSGGGSSAHEVGLDQTQQRSGTAAAYFAAVADSPTGFVTLTQSVRADAYRGKRIRWSGWVKPAGVGTDGGGLWARVDGPSLTLAFDNMSDRPVVGTSDWHQVSVVLDVPENAIGLALGALLGDSGDLLIDDLQLDIVGTDVPVTNQLAMPSPISADSAQVAAFYVRKEAAPTNLDFEGVPGVPDATVAWLAAHAVPFATVEPGNSDSDLEPLREMIGSARVVGMGEGTHGTREFFLLKHRVFRFLVREMGFTHFAIEATWGGSRALNRYVLTGEGNATFLLRALVFWTWNTEEVLDLIEWMREWNITAPPERRVQFAGFDMQHPGIAAGTVLGFIRNEEQQYPTLALDSYACIMPYWSDFGGSTTPKSAEEYRALPSETRAQCRASLQAVYDFIVDRRTTYAAATSPEVYENLLHSARHVQQFEEMIASTDGSVRDRFMAENALWLLEQGGPAARMMLWAHNGHIGRLPGAMGDSLGAELGSDYVNLGFLFGTGQFNAVGVGSEGLRLWSVSLIPEFSVESVFSRTGQPRLLLDTRIVPGGGADAAPLRGPIPMRRVGALFNPAFERNYFFNNLFPQDYDLLMYVEKSTETRLLPFFTP
jgi:erythromycin esterase